eukprot:1631693-Pleurochrysis_carterae.AAC.1
MSARRRSGGRARRSAGRCHADRRSERMGRRRARPGSSARLGPKGRRDVPIEALFLPGVYAGK